jgi:hypothetical protein
MQRIPIKLAKAGMKLAKEAVTPEGQVLCGAGLELTDELVVRLQKQGVVVLTVEGHPVRLPGEKKLSERIKDLDVRFRPVNRNPVLKALKTIIAEYWIEQEYGPEFLEKMKRTRK